MGATRQPLVFFMLEKIDDSWQRFIAWRFEQG